MSLRSSAGVPAVAVLALVLGGCALPGGDDDSPQGSQVRRAPAMARGLPLWAPRPHRRHGSADRRASLGPASQPEGARA